MRAFTTLCVAIVLALNADAAIIGKRTILPYTEKCVANIDAVTSRLDTLSTLFANYQEVDNSLKTQEDHEKLLVYSSDALKDLSSAQNVCCAYDDSITTEDSEAISAALEKYATAAVNAFSTLNSKVAAFNTNGEPYAKVRSTISNMTEPIKDFGKCILQVDQDSTLYINSVVVSTAKVRAALEEVSTTFNAV